MKKWHTLKTYTVSAGKSTLSYELRCLAFSSTDSITCGFYDTNNNVIGDSEKTITDFKTYKTLEGSFDLYLTSDTEISLRILFDREEVFLQSISHSVSTLKN